MADKNSLCFNMNNSLENLPDLQKEELLDSADRFTIRVTDSKGVYKGNAFIAEGHVVSAHHVVDQNYSIHYPQPYTEVSFAQVGDQDIAESVQLFGINGLKRAKNQGDGQRVFLIGRDQENNPFAVSGEIKTTGPIHKGKMEIDVNRRQMNEIIKGMSGSAVVNQRGEAIGVLVQARMGGKGLMDPFK